jgi:hypothetical protein
MDGSPPDCTQTSPEATQAGPDGLWRLAWPELPGRRPGEPDDAPGLDLSSLLLLVHLVRSPWCSCCAAAGPGRVAD